MPRSLINVLVTLAASLMLGHTAATAAPEHPAFQVKVTGSGAPMILIPGLGSPGAVWDGTVAQYCGARYQCHVLSLAGFAGVPATVEGPFLPAVEQQLSEYIAAQKLGQPIVIGHSLGGFIAMKLAADHPAQVGKLIIVDTMPALIAGRMPNMTPEQIKHIAEEMRNRMQAQDEESRHASALATLRTMITRQEDVDRAMGWATQSDRATVIKAMAEMTGEDLRPSLNRITAPTLVLGAWFGYKGMGPKAMFEQLYQTQYQHLAGVKIELADNARHFIMYDDPAWMYDRINHFID